jgi:hypothetical protein
LDLGSNTLNTKEEPETWRNLKNPPVQPSPPVLKIATKTNANQLPKTIQTENNKQIKLPFGANQLLEQQQPQPQQASQPQKQPQPQLQSKQETHPQQQPQPESQPQSQPQPQLQPQLQSEQGAQTQSQLQQGTPQHSQYAFININTYFI